MYLGIDIGGTKTLVATIDDRGVIQEKIKLPTPKDYQEFLQKLKAALDNFPKTTFRYCGIGMPGIIDRTKGASTWSGGNLTWKNSPIAQDVSSIANCPVVVENDANMASLSEANLVKDRYRTVLYITLSTGIGSGFVINGKLDPNTLNAEVGHMIYSLKDNYRTWEQMASGGTIVKQYGQRADEITDTKIWKAISERIAVGLINLSAALTPEIIILGGGVGGHLNRFKEYLDEQLVRLAPSGVQVPPVLQAQHPEEAVLYGCYELAKQKRFGEHAATH
jgi:predicted NBD/HSP70 family sugar kinase